MYWVTGLLGLMLFGAPFVLGYNDNTAALWTSLLIGGTIIIVSLFEAAQSDREQWEYWVAALLGFSAMVIPFLLSFGSQTVELWMIVVMGILITIFAGAKLTTGEWRRHWLKSE